MLCLDDKAVIPVGEPSRLISATARQHNRCLAPLHGAAVAALDHDFHVCGVIPSVAFKCEIPDSPSDSFFSGDVHVVLKDKIFYPSNAFRHGTEIARLVRDKYSPDGVVADKPIMIQYTDGGPDHRTTYGSVHLASIAQFLLLDLDLFVTARTAPMGSWANLAERVNSLLNMGLQHVALDRTSMTDNMEDQMRRISCMRDARRLSDRSHAFKASLEASVQPVLTLLQERLSRLKLKGQRVEVSMAASDAEVTDFFDSLHVIDVSLQQDKVTQKDLSKCARLVDFMAKHCRQRQYMFQVKKCPLDEVDNCWYCFFNPPRLPQDIYQDLCFVPDPMPDPNQQGRFQPFENVYGRPSHLRRAIALARCRSR